jgi:putative transposase
VDAVAAHRPCAGYRQRYGGSGHVWQGRFKSFAIQEDDHLLAVLRYAERNALRANLVSRADDWPWSSLRWWVRPPLLPFVEVGPVPRGSDWVGDVNAPQTEAELARLRECVRRDRPYGDDVWTVATASALGLESSLRPRGRPYPPLRKGADQAGHTLFP